MANTNSPEETADIAEDAGIVDQQSAAGGAGFDSEMPAAGAGFDRQASAEDAGSSPPAGRVSGLIGSASDKARDYANAGKDAATERLDSFSGLIAGLADALGDKLGPQTGDYARKAADTVTQFTEGLKARDVDDLVEDTRKIIKQNPAMAVGAAAALGFVLVRLAKASPRGGDDRDEA